MSVWGRVVSGVPAFWASWNGRCTAITTEQIAAWEAILVEIETACKRGDAGRLIENDMRFHQAILGAYEDESIIILWQMIVLRMMIDYHRHGELMDSYHEHKRILDAIRSGDKQAALAALRANIQPKVQLDNKWCAL